MKKIKIGLLSKKRGNYELQGRIAKGPSVKDLTSEEVAHHKNALIDAGFDVQLISWGPGFIDEIRAIKVDLVFNVFQRHCLCLLSCPRSFCHLPSYNIVLLEFYFHQLRDGNLSRITMISNIINYLFKT